MSGVTTRRFALPGGARALMADLDLDVARILRSARLPPDALDRGRTTLDADDYFALWDALDREYVGGPLPLAIAGALSAEVLDAPIMAGLSCQNLQLAAIRIRDLKPLTGPVEIEVTESANTVRIEYRWPVALEPPTSLVLTELVFWVAFARLATRHPVEPVRITSPHAGSATEDYRGYLGVPVLPAEINAVVFTRSDAERPFLTGGAISLMELAASGDGHALPMATRVREVLVGTLASGEASIGAVARTLRWSARTLQRGLRAEGLNYQRLLASVRRDLAIAYLTHTDFDAVEIAELLAYRDTGSFRRAFREWTGRPPEAFRLDNRRSAPA